MITMDIIFDWANGSVGSKGHGLRQEGRTLYSHSRPIAYLRPDGTAFVDFSYYGTSTRAHQSHIELAVINRCVCLPLPDPENWERESVRRAVKNLLVASEDKTPYEGEIVLDNIRRLPSGWYDPVAIKRFKDHLAAKRKETVEQWVRGEYRPLLLREPYTYLRLVSPRTVETSKGQRLALEDVKWAYRLWSRGLDNLEITDRGGKVWSIRRRRKGVVAGCHIILSSEIERFAKVMEW